MNKRKKFHLERKKAAAVLSVFLIFLAGMIGVYGEKKIKKEIKTVEEEPQQSLSTEETIQVKELVSEEQTALLESLYQCLKQTELTEAARLLNDREQEFLDIYYETMGGMPYFYNGETVSLSYSGSGIWFQSYATVFSGIFGENGLEGQGLALQAIHLDAPRYDYSAGTWKGGRLNGKGMIGYLYYDGIEGEETVEIRKEGEFTEDLMNGMITYTSVSQEHAETIWMIDTNEGVTKLDDRWEYDEEKSEYHLPSVHDQSRIYMQKEEDLGEIRWKNMIPWLE